MPFKHFLEEALHRGENLKDEIVTELLNGRFFKDFIQSDGFAKAVSTVVKTKEEISRVIRDNVKNVLNIMDIPSRNDVRDLNRKVSELEYMVDHLGKKRIPVKILKKSKKSKKSK